MPRPNIVAHADWSVAANKRWMTRAKLGRDRCYNALAPTFVGDTSTLVERLLGEAGPRGRIFLGFDFPIGVPRAYAAKAGITDFLSLLPNLGQGPWCDIYKVARTPEEISLQRPFYPAQSNAQPPVSMDQLLRGLGLADRMALLRHCDRGPPAAAPIFWTVGGNQVGKAALAGWREVVAPALRNHRRDVGIWPFDGALADLLATRRIVLAETYPGEIYSHLNLRFARRDGVGTSGKRTQVDRAANAKALLGWARKADVALDPVLKRLIRDGFGRSTAGEDPFDATVGLFGMLNVVLGRRSSGEPEAPAIRTVEGWILGRSAARTLGAARARGPRDFELHPQLAADTIEVCRLDLCRVLLALDSSYPWVILVPQRADVREIYELAERDRQLLMVEIAQASSVMACLFAPDKLNVAALGNAVPQLHLHVIARYRTDRAWPRPIWGASPAEPYAPERLREITSRLKAAFLSREG